MTRTKPVESTSSILVPRFDEIVLATKLLGAKTDLRSDADDRFSLYGERTVTLRALVDSRERRIRRVLEGIQSLSVVLVPPTEEEPFWAQLTLSSNADKMRSLSPVQREPISLVGRVVVSSAALPGVKRLNQISPPRLLTVTRAA